MLFFLCRLESVTRLAWDRPSSVTCFHPIIDVPLRFIVVLACLWKSCGNLVAHPPARVFFTGIGSSSRSLFVSDPVASLQEVKTLTQRFDPFTGFPSYLVWFKLVIGVFHTVEPLSKGDPKRASVKVRVTVRLLGGEGFPGSGRITLESYRFPRAASGRADGSSCLK